MPQIPAASPLASHAAVHYQQLLDWTHQFTHRIFVTGSLLLSVRRTLFTAHVARLRASDGGILM